MMRPKGQMARLLFDYVILNTILLVTSWDLCPNISLNCTPEGTPKACHCDQICTIMGDCCTDKVAANGTNNTTASADELQYRGHFECLEASKGLLTYKIDTYLPKDDFLYIKSCPKVFHKKDVRMLCEDENTTDIFLHWLVTSRRTHVTYRNVFCGQCWGDIDVFHWRVEYYCDDINATISQNIPVGFPYFGGVKSGFKCKDSKYGSGMPGSEKGENLPPGFNTHTSPKTWFPEMPGEKAKPPIETGVQPPGDQSLHPSWAGIRTDNLKRGENLQKRTTTLSVESQIVPPRKSLGRHTVPPPRVKYEVKLWKRLSSASLRREEQNNKFSDCKPMFVYPQCENLRTCEDLRTVSTCQKRWHGTTLERICKEGKFGRMKLNRDNSIYRNVDCVVCNGINPEHPRCSFNPDSTSSPGYKGTGYTPPPLSMIFDPDAGKLVKETDSTQEKIQLPKCSASQVIDVFAFKCRDVSCSEGYQLTSHSCTKSTNGEGTKNSCLWVQFNYGEYDVINGSTIVLITGHKIPIGNSTVRDMTNSTIYICDSFLPEGWNSIKITFNYSKGVVITSILLQTISLICLLLLFVVYLRLPELRNTPGLTIMSLVVALFYAQFLLMISTTAAGNRQGCVFIAMAIHYFFLASFCWMCSLAFDLTLTFSSSVVNRGDRGSQTCRFVKFSIFGWFTPATIVSIAFLTDVGPSNLFPFNPGYGQGFCWITNRQGLYLWFLSPVTLLLLASIIMYSITVYKIVQATKAAAMVRREDKWNLLLYIKLALIMGLTWTLAFIWVGTRNIVAEYFFIILNSLQGAFIFIAFACRPKVYRLLTRKISKKKKPITSRSTMTSRLSGSHSHTIK